MFTTWVLSNERRAESEDFVENVVKNGLPYNNIKTQFHHFTFIWNINFYKEVNFQQGINLYNLMGLIVLEILNKSHR